MDIDESKKVRYCGVDIHEGALRILFEEKNLAVNIDNALETAKLVNALNEAPAPEGDSKKMSVVSRMAIRDEYEPKIEEYRQKAAELVGKEDLKFNPNFEETFEKLKAESQVKKTELRKDWEDAIGRITFEYFVGLADQLRWQKFEDDDLLQEGFQEAVSKNEVVFRIVDKLIASSYCEVVVEDGILYIQSLAKTWGTNCGNAAEKLVEKLDT
jgi:hypothetical protein